MISTMLMNIITKPISKWEYTKSYGLHKAVESIKGERSAAIKRWYATTNDEGSPQ